MDLQAAIRIPALCCKCLLARAAGAEVGDDDTGLGDGTDRFHRGGNVTNLDPGRPGTFNIRPGNQALIRWTAGPKAGATIKELAAKIAYHRAGCSVLASGYMPMCFETVRKPARKKSN